MVQFVLFQMALKGLFQIFFNFKQSGFFYKISPRVLPNGGFLIKEELMKKKAYLNIPPFLGSRDYFTDV